MAKLMLKILDKYILKRFIGTFIFSITLMLCIFIVFDISEKLQTFIAEKIPLREIIFDHYLNFIPYYGNLFSPLFTFISVIFFTSKMAYKTEFVAILSSGTSFQRILRPYMIGASIITLSSLFLNHFVIPNSNKVRIAFEDKYINDLYSTEEINIHKQIAPGTILYMNHYDNFKNIASQVSIEKVENNRQVYMLKADNMIWDTVNHLWILSNVFERALKYYQPDSTLNDTIIKPFFTEKHKHYSTKKIQMDFAPKDMARLQSKIEVLTYFELKKFINKEKQKGSSRIEFLKWKCISEQPFLSLLLFLLLLECQFLLEKLEEELVCISL
jgi:lipopolysaccharide export system permease protein